MNLVGNGISVTIMVVILVATVILGIYAGRRRQSSLEEWSLGSRGFGAFLLWFLMGGEIYTTAAFLGAAGWIYAKGAPGFYLMANVPLAYALGYYLLPKVNKMGRRTGAMTLSDYFRDRFESKWLAGLMALVALIAIIPYFELQLKGLGIIVNIATHGVIKSTPAVWVGALLIAAFVILSGIRSTAWTSVVKDGLMIVVLFSIGIGIPLAYGGTGHVFQAVRAKMPELFTLPGHTTLNGVLWFMTTLVVVNIGYWAWPHLFAAAYTAKSARSLKRNAVFVPLYSLAYYFIFVVAFTAIIAVPGLKNSDSSLLFMVDKVYPAWVLGVVGATGALVALVPGSALVINGSLLFTKNILKETLGIRMSDRRMFVVSRITLVALLLIGVGLALSGSNSIVGLILIAYNAIGQLAPGILLGMYTKMVNKYGVFVGMLVGIVLVNVKSKGLTNALTLHHQVNSGFTVIIINLALAVIISAFTSRTSAATLARYFDGGVAS
jgi:solute:Na+ symporter, SSS family